MIEKEVVPYWEIDELIDSYRLHIQMLQEKGISTSFWEGCIEGLTVLKDNHKYKWEAEISPNLITTSAENP